MARQYDVIWAAGFFDGEGCISIQRQVRPGGVYFYLGVSVYQNDFRPLLEFSELFGGAIYPEKNAQKWRASGRDAAEALNMMLPYMRVKKEQALVAIDFQSRRLPPGQNRPKGFSVEADERDYLRCRELKKVI